MEKKIYVSRGNSESLSHHGILGQKWGIRRYQNEDGSLTTEGKLRYGTVENLQKIKNARAQSEANKIAYKSYKERMKFETKIKKAQDKQDKKEEKEAKKELEKETKEAKKQLEKERKEELVRESKRRKASDMTDAELQNAIIRLRTEQEYNRLAFPQTQKQKEQAQAIKNEGKSFAKKFVDQAIVPATIDVSKKVATSWLEKQLTDKWGKQLGLSKSKYKEASEQAQYAKDLLNKEKWSKELKDLLSDGYKASAKDSDREKLKEELKEWLEED